MKILAESEKRYPHVANLLHQHSQDAQNSLEIGCGGSKYRDCIIHNYVGLDLPHVRYAGPGPSVFGDGQSLPFENSSFDFVFMVGVLYIIPDVELALQEIFRVLRTDGKLLVLDYNFLGTLRLSRLSKASQSTVTHVWSGWSLAWLIEQAGFNSKVEWNYSRGSSKIALFFQQFKIVRLLRFWIWQLKSDWSVVIGYKGVDAKN